jgi:hypothetical protein
MKPKTTSAYRPLWLGAAMAAALVAMIQIPSALGHGNKDGLDIKIRAENRSVNDTPFCGLGGGAKGDRLDVDVETDASGIAYGTATYEAADGTVTIMNIDEVFSFFGGLALLDSATRNTVAIWFNQAEEMGASTSPAHINVELPRGCGNTVSTFTVDADKATMQIKFQ